MKSVLGRSLRLLVIFAMHAKMADAFSFNINHFSFNVQTSEFSNFSQSMAQTQAVIPALAGAVFVGAAVYPEGWSHTLALIRAHANEILTGLSLVVPAAIMGPRRNGNVAQRPPSHTASARDFTDQDPYRIERTVIASVLRHMLEEAEDAQGVADVAVARAGKKATTQQLGAQSTATAYRIHVQTLWDANLASEFDMSVFQREMYVIAEHRIRATERLFREPRIQFLRWYSMRMRLIPGLVPHHAKGELDTRGWLLDQLEALNLDNQGPAGHILVSYYSTVIDRMSASQQDLLKEAIVDYRNSKRTRRGQTGSDLRDIKISMNIRYGLDNDASSVFQLIALSNSGSGALQDAAVFYLSALLFPRLVTNELIAPSQTELKEWISHQPAGRLMSVEGVRLRDALAKEYDLPRAEEEALVLLRLSDSVKLIPRTPRSHGETLASVIWLALIGAGAWHLQHGFPSMAGSSPDTLLSGIWLLPVFGSWKAWSAHLRQHLKPANIAVAFSSAA